MKELNKVVFISFDEIRYFSSNPSNIYLPISQFHKPLRPTEIGYYHARHKLYHIYSGYLCLHSAFDNKENI